MLGGVGSEWRRQNGTSYPHFDPFFAEAPVAPGYHPSGGASQRSSVLVSGEEPEDESVDDRSGEQRIASCQGGHNATGGLAACTETYGGDGDYYYCVLSFIDARIIQPFAPESCPPLSGALGLRGLPSRHGASPAVGKQYNKFNPILLWSVEVLRTKFK